ncbi:MAG: hypothetical protein LUQ31_01715 [Methanoregula sp.]|nr:hypothetical protein [Methanoregula sp.]
MGLDDLRSILLSERETGKLIQISPDIFERTHAEIAALLAKVYAIEDPISDEARVYIEETIAIKETLHDLFSIRSRKILTLATMHAEGNYYDREEVKKMIPPERRMFDQITAGIEQCQNTLLKNEKQPLVPPPAPVTVVPPVPNTETAAVVPAAAATEDDWEAAYEDASAAAGEKEQPAAAVPSPPSVSPSLTPPYLLVRVLADMDTFMGVDGRIYSLAKGDIVTLPERNATVLSDRNIVLAITLPTCK